MNTKDVDLFIQDDLGVHLPNAKEPTKDALKTEVLRYMSKKISQSCFVKSKTNAASNVDIKEYEFDSMCLIHSMEKLYAENGEYKPIKKPAMWKFWLKYHKNPEMWDELQNMLAKVKQFIAAQKE